MIAIDELKEEAYLKMMQAYIELKDRKSALNLYSKLKKILKKELNLAPIPEIQDVIANLYH